MYGLIKMQNPGLPAEENLSETVFGEMDKNKVWHNDIWHSKSEYCCIYVTTLMTGGWRDHL